MQLTFYVTQFYSVLTIAANIIFAGTLLALIIPQLRKHATVQKYLSALKSHVLSIGLTVSTLATLGSLYFSEIAQYNPCKLCWFQRIFMYPLVILFGLALYRKEKTILPYALTLSIIGAGIAAYHYFLQVQKILFPNFDIAAPCGLVGYAPSCTNYFVLQFGYITIPMMAFSAFALIITATIIAIRNK